MIVAKLKLLTDAHGRVSCPICGNPAGLEGDVAWKLNPSQFPGPPLILHKECARTLGAQFHDVAIPTPTDYRSAVPAQLRARVVRQDERFAPGAVCRGCFQPIGEPGDVVIEWTSGEIYDLFHAHCAIRLEHELRDATRPLQQYLLTDIFNVNEDNPTCKNE